MNSRFDDSASALSCLADDEARGGKDTQPPQFCFEATEKPALRRAARDSGVETLEKCDLLKTARLMTALLKHGADPYALFRQAIFS